MKVSDEKLQFSRRYPPIPEGQYKIFMFYEPHSEPYRGVVAVLLTNGKAFVGVSLCSPLDQFIKKVGKSMALGRAVRAYVKELSVGSIPPGTDPKPFKEWLVRLANGALEEEKSQMFAKKVSRAAAWVTNHYSDAEIGA